MEKKGRIMYLDALRGLAIFLVVYCHVASISLGIPEGIGSTNDIVSLLHLPLFFFLSGFLMFREDRFIKEGPTYNYLGRKILELVVPALVFVSIFALWSHRSFDSIVHSQFKGGYWFTFFLFLFILIYAILSLLFRKVKIKTRVSIILVLSVGVGLAPTFVDIIFPQWIDKEFMQIISYQNFKYFLFFAFGAWIRSRYDEFLQWSDSNQGNLCLIGVPFLMLFLHHFHIPHLHPFVEWLFSLSSVLLFLTLFRRAAGLMEHSKAGKAVAFMGQRSLDIYFLHFFILPRLHNVGAFFSESNNRILEFFTVSLLVVAVIVVCLGFSYILRQSDCLARILFGKADKQTNNPML